MSEIAAEIVKGVDRILNIVLCTLILNPTLVSHLQPLVANCAANN